MTRYLNALTDEQRAAMDAHADEWIRHGWSTEPADWDLFADAAERCYGFAGLPWHGRLVRVSSPLVLALAAPRAALVLAALKRGAVGGAVRGAVGGAVGDAVRGAVGDAVGGPVGGPVGGAVRGAVGGAVRGAVRDAVRDAVDGPVGGAVRGPVGGAVRDAVRDAVGGAVDGAVGGAVDGAVYGAVGDAVGDAVDGAVGGPVGGAVGDAVRKTTLSLWYHRLWGNLWPYWQAYNSYFRDHCNLELDGDLWDRSRAYEDTAKAAGWWWPHKEFVMVCDRPAALHLEQVAPKGWGSHRLHCETGPAIAWRDGYALHYWHGTHVPAALIEGRWTTADILRERNAEVRRCAIERMGWDRFITEAGLAQVGHDAPDPGNPGHTIALYEVPEQIYDEPVRVLLCTNGTVERDGTRRRFGLTVPATIDDPVAAAAWTYGINPSEYRQAEARR